MKIYVASKFENQEKVLKIYERLRNNGHKITVDWTKSDNEKAKKDPETAKEYSERDINGVKDADVFVILPIKEHGRSMYIELGTAMMLNLLTGKPKIFVIGEENTESIFYFHPTVNRVDTIEDVIKELEKSEGL